MSYHLRLGFWNSGFHTKIQYPFLFSSIRATCPASPHLCTTDHEAPHCANFPNLPLQPPSYTQTCSSALQGIRQSPRPGVSFRNTLNFFTARSFFIPSPSLRAGRPPLVGCLLLLIQYTGS